MKIFTQNHKVAGEMAVRQMSDKARDFYDNADPFNVYEYTDWDDNTLYACDGCFGTKVDLSFEQIRQFMEDMYDTLEEVDEA